jgi:rhamnose utilization protein RhaD (predicted bifunctional aldolase and dehydrogenase)/NAD(P)-dependent dehydrogenase (short-subunit alcohol dehydrogenase family)
MKNLWNDSESLKYIKYYKKHKVSKDLALRIYTTHLLGGEKKLVLHGGGNTSVKTNYTNIFGEDKKVIYVKGSGWDMSNLTEEGMPGLNIEPLLKTLLLEKLNDEKMVNFLRSNLIDSNSPNPSVETLLHAYLPHKYVDHTHSNAFLSLVNLKNSEEICKKIFNNKLGIVPYTMPGFDLAKLCHQTYLLNNEVEGLILLNHGIFTFGETAKHSYDRMIKYVNIVEKFISNNKRNNNSIKDYQSIKNINIKKFDNLPLLIRKIFYKIDGNKWIVKLNNSEQDIKFSLLKNLKLMFSKGPVTPDHVIRIKSKPLIIKLNDINKIDKFISKYTKDYIKYFQKYKNNISSPIISDPLPRIIIIEGLGYFSIGRNAQEEKISLDIFGSMKLSIIDSHKIGIFQSINNKEIFKMEYWPLERAKLSGKKRKTADGQVVVITGGAGTIGLATANKFLTEGAEVVILDKKIDTNSSKYSNLFSIDCDLTNQKSIDSALKKIVNNFGGIDILISNAGTAFQGLMDSLDELILRKSFEINFYAHQKIASSTVQLMKIQSTGGSIMFNISKQAINPGKNFGPYGLPKSSTLFLMKQYALECGQFDIRVNGINADRIQSGILTDKLIKQRSKARNLSIDKYLSNTLLKKEVLPEDVANAFFVQSLLKKTTGNIITVDGGNIEASLR